MPKRVRDYEDGLGDSIKNAARTFSVGFGYYGRPLPGAFLRSVTSVATLAFTRALYGPRPSGTLRVCSLAILQNCPGQRAARNASRSPRPLLRFKSCPRYQLRKRPVG